ncbi:MAG TPA: GAF domain-containing protein [Acidimicrobiales bacterium]|nr:GAF domain-containing protein [Acidimicrobiales bacterium]
MAGERRRREHLLLRAGFDLAADVTPAVVVQRIVDLAAELADAARACLIVLGDDGQVRRFVTSGVARERRKVDRTEVEQGLLGPVLRSGQAVRITGVKGDPSLVGLSRDHDPVAVVAVPVHAGRRQLGALWLVDSEAGEEFTEDDERALGFFAAQAGVALENARLLEEARVRQRALEGVKEVSQALLEGRSTDDVLQLVARWAQELVGSSFAGVATPIGEGDTLVVRVVEGDHTEGMVGRCFNAANSISGEVIRTLRPVIVADASVDHRTSQPMVQRGVLGPALFIPLAMRDRPFGTLAVANVRGGSVFSADDVLVVQTFANEATVALEYARIREELERLTLLEERERIAMELHDGVVQTLFAVGLSLQVEGEDEPEDMRRRRFDAVTSIDRAIRDLRNYIYGLSPEDLADRHLERALRDMSSSFEQSALIEIVTSIDPRAASALAHQSDTVLQAAREAVSNAVRHSGAGRIELRFFVVGQEAVVEVADDGRGFDAGHVTGNGRGLANLKSRAETLGGVLEIEPVTGGGTMVRIRVPLSS